MQLGRKVEWLAKMQAKVPEDQCFEREVEISSARVSYSKERGRCRKSRKFQVTQVKVKVRKHQTSIKFEETENGVPGRLITTHQIISPLT